jgi:hypothetical protein
MRSLHNNPNPDLTEYRTHFFNHIGWSRAELFAEYIKRGWLLRLKRFVQEH